jgi:exopolysaccharide biosynthesis protein
MFPLELFVKFRILVFILCALCILCGQLSAQDFKTIHYGVEYAEVTRDVAGQRVKMNLLRLDLTKVRLDVVHANDRVIGTDKTSLIAVSHAAVAAVNAGFFRLDTSAFAGDPDGILQIDGKLLSESNNGRIALEITNDPSACASCRIPKNQTVVSFDHLNTYAEFWSRQNRFNISGINRQLKDNDAVLYTSEFGDVTPHTELKALEIVIENKKIKQILETNGGTKIPLKGYVLTAVGTKKTEAASMTAAGNEALTIIGSYSDREPTPDSKAVMKFIDVEDVIGGAPQLVKNGKVDVTWEKEKTTKSFVDTRHPRTAVAKLTDGRFLMITVDGRSESSGGIGLYDLAALLVEFGATDAMNLDGGGSTTMFLDGKVVNHPSDKEGERSVSDALIVTLRKKLPKKEN